MRPSGRPDNVLREISFELQFNKHAEGSCLVKFGHTHVICTATVETRLPSWLRDSGRGWITAEYGMLPRSTNERTSREAARGKQSGRTQEIQRLIGRSLRAVTNLEAMPELQIRIDCDVLQADGGTRTASITGGFLALQCAIDHVIDQGLLMQSPLIDHVAAVSCGLHDSAAILDLDYAEDSTAQADANFVLTGSGGIVEVQATGEERAFSSEEFSALFSLARGGIKQLIAMQKDVLSRRKAA